MTSQQKSIILTEGEMFLLIDELRNFLESNHEGVMHEDIQDCSNSCFTSIEDIEEVSVRQALIKKLMQFIKEA